MSKNRRYLSPEIENSLAKIYEIIDKEIESIRSNQNKSNYLDPESVSKLSKFTDILLKSDTSKEEDLTKLPQEELDKLLEKEVKRLAKQKSKKLTQPE